MDKVDVDDVDVDDVDVDKVALDSSDLLGNLGTPALDGLNVLVSLQMCTVSPLLPLVLSCSVGDSRS